MVNSSLPGSALYSIKTDIIEQLDTSVQLSDESRAHAQIRLLENRLDELKKLAKRDDISDDALAKLQTVADRHRATFMDTLGDTQSGSTTVAELRMIADFSHIASAMEVIAENDGRMKAFGDYVEDVRREAVNAYRDKIDRFVERETPENIFNLIATNLTAVSTALENENLTKDTINDAETYIARVEPSLTEGDYPRALNAIAEAMRFIQIDLHGAYAFIKTDANEATPNERETSTTTESATTSTAVPTEEPAGSFRFVQ